MHKTLEGVQQSATPAIRGPLQVYLVVLALVLTVTAPSRLAQVIAAAMFLGLAIDAVGVRPLRWLSVPVFFLLPGLAIILVTTPGQAVVEVGPLTITHGGVETVLDTLTRSAASIVVLGFLIASTPVSTVIATLRRAGLPSVLVELLLYVYRAIGTVFVEAERMQTAAKARVGYYNRRAKIRTTKLIASTLFLRTIDRVTDLDEAMRARGYAGNAPATAEVESHGYGLSIGVLAVLLGVRVL
jgi:cobalt/nickel transport system permease protein